MVLEFTADGDASDVAEDEEFTALQQGGAGGSSIVVSEATAANEIMRHGMATRAAIIGG